MHPSHFFKYCTARVAKIVLSTQKVRWNSPLNFNDPFDCHFSLELKFDLSEMAIQQRERILDLLLQREEPRFDATNPYARILSAMRQRLEGTSRQRLRDVLSSCFNDYVRGLESVGSLERERWRRQMAEYRVFCVCESNENLLLWSHYTNNHAGVVFQFECIAELDVPLLAAQAVHYADQAPALATQNEWLAMALGLRPLTTGEEAWRRLVTTKARVWEHEKEWRVITTRRPHENQGYEDTPFHPREISRVFLGCKITYEDREGVLAFLGGPFAHAEVYQARLHPTMYRLQFDRIK